MANEAKTTLFGKPVDESDCIQSAELDERDVTDVISSKEADKRVKKNGGGLLRPEPQR